MPSGYERSELAWLRTATTSPLDAARAIGARAVSGMRVPARCVCTASVPGSTTTRSAPSTRASAPPRAPSS